MRLFTRLSIGLIVVAAPMLLAACGDRDAAPPAEAPSLAAELATDNAVDPLLASVVNDPLMTDLQLSTRSNINAVRPPDQPYSAMIPAADIGDVATVAPAPAPTASDASEGECAACRRARSAPTLAALAARQDDAQMRRCAPALDYSAAWAARLAGDMPLPASARVIEAGGVERSDCTVRAVAFAATTSATDLIAETRARATRAGYAVDEQSGGAEHVMTGRRARDGATFQIYVHATPRGGSEARLVANTGT